MSGPAMSTAGEKLLEAWQESGLEDVTLPSGFRVRIRPVSPSQLITAGLLPYELIGALVAAEESGSKPSADVLGKAALEYVGKERSLAAAAVRDIWSPEGWEPITLEPTAFDSGAFPPDDADAIVEAAMARIRVAADTEVDPEGLATFRDEPESPLDRSHGGAVRPASVEPRRARRTAARAGAGRGDRDPAGPG